MKKQDLSNKLNTIEIGKQNSMCKDKRRYTDYKVAKWFARAMAQRVYKCPYCKGYHLTTKF